MGVKKKKPSMLAVPGRGRRDAAADRELQVRVAGVGRAAAATSSGSSTRKVTWIRSTGVNHI